MNKNGKKTGVIFIGKEYSRCSSNGRHSLEFNKTNCILV